MTEHIDDSLVMESATAVLKAYKLFLWTENPADRKTLRMRVEESISRLRRFTHTLDQTGIASSLEEALSHLDALELQPVVQQTSWREEALSDFTLQTPSMLNPDTLRYYKWVARQITGVGEAVELGCWLGSSSNALAEGMVDNTACYKKTLHVYDSFRWERWMEAFVHPLFPKAHDLWPGKCYIDLFRSYTAAYADQISPSVTYVYSGAEFTDRLPSIQWHGLPIELFVYDMGPHYEQISVAWEIFQPSFVSDKTIVIFNEHGNLQAGQLRRFCREHAEELLPLHKTLGSTKGFRYKLEGAV